MRSSVRASVSVCSICGFRPRALEAAGVRSPRASERHINARLDRRAAESAPSRARALARARATHNGALALTDDKWCDRASMEAQPGTANCESRHRGTGREGEAEGVTRGGSPRRVAVVHLRPLATFATYGMFFFFSLPSSLYLSLYFFFFFLPSRVYRTRLASRRLPIPRFRTKRFRFFHPATPWSEFHRFTTADVILPFPPFVSDFFLLSLVALYSRMFIWRICIIYACCGTPLGSAL